MASDPMVIAERWLDQSRAPICQQGWTSADAEELATMLSLYSAELRAEVERLTRERDEARAKLQELADEVLASATIETSRGLIAKAMAVEKVRGPK